MSFGTVQVGRLPLREATTVYDDKVNASSGIRTVSISGQEALPPRTAAELVRVQDDVGNLMGALVPVTWTDKADRDGYYEVRDVGSKLLSWQGEVVTCDWNLTLQRHGADTEVDLESRLGGAATRNNSFGASGERWHAPPIGHYAYWTGATQPSTVTRTGTDGAMTVYRGVPVDVAPRWGCAVGDYLAGRVRLLDANDLERTGLGFALAASDWEVHNGLVRVRPLASSGVLEVSAYTGGAWRPKAWDVLTGGVSIGAFDAASVLYNEPELVVIRLLRSQSSGRITVDVSLRRGARTAELYVQAAYSSTLKVVRAAAEAGTAATGYVRATADDADGNRFIVGSALTHTADTAAGGISLAATTTLDAVVGVIAGGSGAVAGDQPADLFAQYLGAPAESVTAVRR
ncbi:hypothetical protein [Saccharothrix xinjiangensis]|uniref:Uncharacterized protein n=1 Tax=Saccharothrix xinjiangensis TaxID=204798 RepID=A0ABV9XW55_9PSEU